jgi:hypothetical protein
MDPGDDEHRALQHALPRRVEEIDGEERAVIAEIAAEEGIADARHQHVLGEEERDEEAERILHRLRRAEPQRLALPERVEREEEMREEGAVKEGAAEPARIDAVEIPHRVLGDVERDEAESMIEKMADHEAEHDQPGNQTDAPYHPGLSFIAPPPRLVPCPASRRRRSRGL